MPKGKLSKRQAAIYEYICSYTDQHGYPPSVREIGAAANAISIPPVEYARKCET